MGSRLFLHYLKWPRLDRSGLKWSERALLGTIAEHLRLHAYLSSSFRDPPEVIPETGLKEPGVLNSSGTPIASPAASPKILPQNLFALLGI